MTYNANWTHANAQGLLDSRHYLRRPDLAEIGEAINRRRRLIFQTPLDYPSRLAQQEHVSQFVLDDSTDPPVPSMRRAIWDVLGATAGSGSPPNPQSIQWLWPVAGSDENKPLTGTWPPPSGHVHLLQQINGTSDWSDPVLAEDMPARAVHLNELRRALEWLRRGRWELPIYWNLGLFSVLPDVPWVGAAIANNGTAELRSLGELVAQAGDLGLVGVDVRSASMAVSVSTACRVQLRQCLRPIDYVNDSPTWNHYRGTSQLPWSQPGGAGDGDSVVLGEADAAVGVPGVIAGEPLRAAVQAMLDGAGPNFMLRRLTTGTQMIDVAATLSVEFELRS